MNGAKLRKNGLEFGVWCFSLKKIYKGYATVICIGNIRHRIKDRCACRLAIGLKTYDEIVTKWKITTIKTYQLSAIATFFDFVDLT